MLKLNFLKIRNRCCVQMIRFSTALGSVELCSFCPQWERLGVQCLVRLGVVVFGPSPSTPIPTPLHCLRHLWCLPGLVDEEHWVTRPWVGGKHVSGEPEATLVGH